MSLGSQIMLNRLDRKVTNWLYGRWDEQKYSTFAALYGLPLVHEYFDYKLDKRASSEYMSRYQLKWSDIHDPRKLQSTSSTAAVVGSGYNYVSKNVNRLYSNHQSNLRAARNRYRPRYRSRR